MVIGFTSAGYDGCRYELRKHSLIRQRQSVNLSRRSQGKTVICTMQRFFASASGNRQISDPTPVTA
jgi:hypothetical protein